MLNSSDIRGVQNMALPAIAIGTAAALEAQGLLKAGSDIALGGGAQYIRDGQPIGIIPLIGQAVARQACRRYADNPDALPGDTAANYEKACRPYLEDIGYGAGPQIDKPFDGGQCATNYTVEVRGNVNVIDCNTGNVFNAGPAFNARAGIRGPISGLTLALTGGGACGPTSSEVRGVDGNGLPFSFPGLNGVNQSSRVSYTGVTFTLLREDGQPDNCGNPAPIVTGPVPPSAPGPVREPFAPSPGTDIDIDLTIGPTGDITFNIGVGPVTIDPFGDGGDGGDGDGDNPGIDQPGTAPSSGLPPGDIGQPGEPSETPPGGSAAGCAPANSVLVGIKIFIVAAPEFGSEYDPQVRRGVCYAYMGVPGNLALEPSGVALRSGQMLFAPLDNLTCWQVVANTGYVLQVVPYYRALELDEV